MKRTLCSDWLPEWTRRDYLARSGFPALFPQKQNILAILNLLLTKLVRSRWLDIGLVFSFFLSWTEISPRSVNTQKKRTGPISSQHDRTRLVNNAYSLQHRHIFVLTGFMSKNDWAIRVVIKLSCAKRMDSKSLVLLIFSKS